MHYTIGMESERDKQLKFIQALLDRTGMKPTPFAKAAGVDHTTLKRFLDGITRSLHSDTIEKIKAKYGIPETHSPDDIPVTIDLLAKTNLLIRRVEEKRRISLTDRQYAIAQYALLKSYTVRPRAPPCVNG